jgi:hypothetical protein
MLVLQEQFSAMEHARELRIQQKGQVVVQMKNVMAQEIARVHVHLTPAQS